MGAEGLEPNWQDAGKTALSEKAGAQAGAIGFDSDSQGQFVERALADLQRAWLTFKEWEAAALPTDAKRVQNLRGGLALLMNELEALTADSE